MAARHNRHLARRTHRIKGGMFKWLSSAANATKSLAGRIYSSAKTLRYRPRTKQNFFHRRGKQNFFNGRGYENDKNIVLKAVEKDGLQLRNASARLKDDKDVVWKAVLQNGEAFHFASDYLKNDPELGLLAKHYKGFKYIENGQVLPAFRNNPELNSSLKKMTRKSESYPDDDDKHEDEDEDNKKDEKKKKKKTKITKKTKTKMTMMMPTTSHFVTITPVQDFG